MHLGIDFWMDFGGFWEGKWEEVGANIGAQIDIGVKAEKSTKRQRASAKLGSEGPRREAKSIKNRLKIEVQDSMPLGIEFTPMLVAFGKQIGQGYRAKMLPKSISKGIQKRSPLKLTIL